MLGSAVIRLALNVCRVCRGLQDLPCMVSVGLDSVEGQPIAADCPSAQDTSQAPKPVPSWGPDVWRGLHLLS